MPGFATAPGCGCCDGGAPISCDYCSTGNAAATYTVALSGVVNQDAGACHDCANVWNTSFVVGTYTPVCTPSPAFPTDGDSCYQFAYPHPASTFQKHLTFAPIIGYTCNNIGSLTYCSIISMEITKKGSNYWVYLSCYMYGGSGYQDFEALFQKDFGTSKPNCETWSSESIPYVSQIHQVGTSHGCDFSSASCNITAN